MVLTPLVMDLAITCDVTTKKGAINDIFRQSRFPVTHVYIKMLIFSNTFSEAGK